MGLGSQVTPNGHFTTRTGTGFQRAAIVQNALLLSDRQPCLAQAVDDVLCTRGPPVGCHSPAVSGNNEMGIKPKDLSGLGPRALCFPQMRIHYSQPSSAWEVIGISQRISCWTGHRTAFLHEPADCSAATFPSAVGRAADAVGGFLACVLVPRHGLRAAFATQHLHLHCMQRPYNPDIVLPPRPAVIMMNSVNEAVGGVDGPVVSCT